MYMMINLEIVKYILKNVGVCQDFNGENIFNLVILSQNFYYGDVKELTIVKIHIIHRKNIILQYQ